jgi:hypothetical protein
VQFTAVHGIIQNIFSTAIVRLHWLNALVLS